MKKINKHFLAILLGAMLPAVAFAQKTLRDILAEEFCVELNKKEFPKVWDESSIQLLGSAMLPTITAHAEEIKQQLGIDLDSEAGMEEIGTVIGSYAVSSCPKFKDMMEKMMQPKVDEVMTADSYEGKFLGLDTGGKFAFLRVEDTNGREQKVWWLEYFPGSEAIVKSPKSWVGKRVKITYVEREVYEAQLKEYIKIKIAVGLETN